MSQFHVADNISIRITDPESTIKDRNATLVQKFIYCERNIRMEVFTIIALPQEQLQLKQTLALFAEHICWIVLIGVMMG